VASSLEVPSLLADPKGATSSEDYEDVYACCKGLSTLTLHSCKIVLIKGILAQDARTEQSGADRNGMERQRNDVKKWGTVWNGVNEVCMVRCVTEMGICNG
jgi:hypothetical protein